MFSFIRGKTWFSPLVLENVLPKIARYVIPREGKEQLFWGSLPPSTPAPPPR